MVPNNMKYEFEFPSNKFYGVKLPSKRIGMIGESPEQALTQLIRENIPAQTDDIEKKVKGIKAKLSKEFGGLNNLIKTICLTRERKFTLDKFAKELEQDIVTKAIHRYVQVEISGKEIFYNYEGRRLEERITQESDILETAKRNLEEKFRYKHISSIIKNKGHEGIEIEFWYDLENANKALATKKKKPLLKFSYQE